MKNKYILLKSFLFIIMLTIFAAGLSFRNQGHTEQVKVTSPIEKNIRGDGGHINPWNVNDAIKFIAAVTWIRAVEYNNQVALLKAIEREQKIKEARRLSDEYTRNKKYANGVQQNAPNPHSKQISYAGSQFVRNGSHICYGQCVLPSNSCAIPQYICNREATYVNEQYHGPVSSNACGKYQFLGSTWGGYKGYPNACVAPESVQDERAAQVYNGGAGAGNWACC